MMPILNTNKNNQQFYLPSTEHAEDKEDRAWVVLDISPQKVDDILGATDGMTSAQVGLVIMTNRIVEWNYQDAEGKILEINYDNVAMINRDDYEFLLEKVHEGKDLTSEEKKTSSATSTPLEAAELPPTI